MSADEWCALDSLDDALLIAPPGCGKTELLARRAAEVAKRRLLPVNRRVLAVTFANKARDNLASRLAQHLGRDFRRYVTLVNFHGLALHLYDRHRYVLEDGQRDLVPDDRALRALERRAFREFDVDRTAQEEVRLTIRDAKAGPFTHSEVLERLEAAGSDAALWYEQQLRAESRMDHDDVLRLGLRIIKHGGVAALYAERFAYVLVDEAQDLTRVQFELVEPIGRKATVFAGDRAQGIYGFAGADPDWVFDRIRHRSPIRVQLDRSYRSSPAVLAVVSAIAGELGGGELTSAEPERWAGRGRAALAEFPDPEAEADWLLKTIASWQSEGLSADSEKSISVGVLTRMKAGGRRDTFLERLREAGIPVEVWDHPLHRSDVVRLLRRHVDGVLATVGDPHEQVEELYLRCMGDVAPENASTLVDLRDAADELSDGIATHNLRTLIDDIRIDPKEDASVSPGLHVLTGHSGKGQGFDKVVILGFEEGQIPSFFVRGLDDRDAKVLDELALLHVMASRAKEDLVLTVCRNVNGYRQRPSRWSVVVRPHLEVPTREA